MSLRNAFLAILISLLFAGCATIPAQEMSEARQALRAAETANAPRKAAEEYARARKLLEQAEDHLSRQEYKAAKGVAREAKGAALEAREAAMEAPDPPSPR